MLTEPEKESPGIPGFYEYELPLAPYCWFLRAAHCAAHNRPAVPWICQRIPLGPDVVVHDVQPDAGKRGHRLGGYGSLAGRRPCRGRSGVPWPCHSGCVDWQEGSKPRDDNDRVCCSHSGTQG